ncbi:hypothetical protein HBI56_112440 [Parastagonospora nodorum]|uniref:Uncharacterized protein n=1 Tax=Phaeosphaeria nodorum (strain SN15 / ATCC MYA-4574 / FGSC 10173) TaxID=321614 RepID=A0A7U2HUU8_PHANO|nr:hypothetical protein HBH56_045080 [Parastagonospora nodorum]QRC92715.1 hypothetical protein JI435_082310 [Parastagonospora nodorum SN15]KAH3932920.1 hypothetical protein HBH54_072830 [Parastagonospora nodorum]KAH3946408.1 hypothetical protein HBH53_131990 [Parastagonospora nodorum]KAH3973096.1 hypothetical protein HBH52_144870 [Parastagonospora nodorum]
MALRLSLFPTTAFAGTTFGLCRRLDWQVRIANSGPRRGVGRERTTPGKPQTEVRIASAGYAGGSWVRRGGRGERPGQRIASDALCTRRVVSDI